MDKTVKLITMYLAKELMMLLEKHNKKIHNIEQFFENSN